MYADDLRPRCPKAHANSTSPPDHPWPRIRLILARVLSRFPDAREALIAELKSEGIDDEPLAD